MTGNVLGSIGNIQRILARVESYVTASASLSAQSKLGRTSKFWEGTFAERPNFPSVAEFLAFRRANYGYGMADERQGSLADERAHTARAFEIFRHSVPLDRATVLDEATLGAPYIFPHHGVYRSSAFWTNAATSLRVQDILCERGMAERPLNILEIGAGWGCMAHQLHQLLNVKRYTIVDLPENLTLSATYLSCSLDRTLRLGAEENDAELVCALPGDATALGVKFDLVVNSFSLQEMEIETVQEYFSWIAEVLTDDGIFVSFNSHGKSGVRVPQDYPLDKFRIETLGMFRSYPSGLLNTIPYEMVLSLRKDDRTLEIAPLNSLCCLMQFGLGDDLKEICNAFVKQSLNNEMTQALRDLSGYFSPSPISREEALQNITTKLPSQIVSYLRGLDAFARGATKESRKAMEEALDSGLKGFARLRASAHLAILTKKTQLPGWNHDFDAQMAYPELASMLEASDFNPFKLQFERNVGVDLLGKVPTI